MESLINICCAVIQTSLSIDDWDDTWNKAKTKLLEDIIVGLNKDTDLLILPAGFYNSFKKKPNTIFKELEKVIVALIAKYNANITICFGVDGRRKTDQLLLAITRKGIVAVARKFHHMDKSIELADTAFSLEQNMPRDITVKNKKAYLAVCYDIFGIAQTKLTNVANYDFIIGVIHGFGKSGGDSDFARKGLAGASKQWNIHSYASAVFSDNRNPTNWTSGVEWKHGDASVKNFNYDDIRIECQKQILNTHIGAVHLNYYIE